MLKLASRGRPSGKYRSHTDLKLLEYLAWISTKYEIDANKFFKNLVEAWNNQTSECKGLKIKCRNKGDNRATFLITHGSLAITQFHMPEYLLRIEDPLRDFVYKIKASRKTSKETKETFSNIGDLRVGMKGVNVKARVYKIPEPKQVFTRFGSYAFVANVLIGDETGTTKLSLWNNQINAISVGDRVNIENAKVAKFRGEPQLRISRHGKLTIIEK